MMKHEIKHQASAAHQECFLSAPASLIFICDSSAGTSSLNANGNNITR